MSPSIRVAHHIGLEIGKRIYHYCKGTSADAKVAHLAVTGNSQGGFQAWWMNALDFDVDSNSTDVAWMASVGQEQSNNILSGFTPYGSGNYYFNTVSAAEYIASTRSSRPSSYSFKLTGSMGDTTSPISGIIAIWNALSRWRCKKQLAIPQYKFHTKHPFGNTWINVNIQNTQVVDDSGDEEDSHVHTDKTEIRNVKAATCCEAGYTGDTYCQVCNMKIESGSVIQATGKHTDADGKWESSDVQHWHTCYYGTKFDITSHRGGSATCTQKAVCSECGHSYGNYGSHSYTSQIKKAETLKSAGTCKNEEVYYYSCSVCGVCEHNDSHTFLGSKDSHTHTGNTEIKNVKAATCCEAGYTGDTYCKDCSTKIGSGSVIPATGKHTDADSKWETNGTKHWHTCYYGTTFDEAKHSGGTATCKQKAVCKDCGAEYGDYTVHQLVKHDRVEPTFENDGNIEYWTCNECGKYFSDAQGNNEISAKDTVIGKLTIIKLSYLDGEVLIEVPSNAVSGEFIITVDKIVPPPSEIVEKVKDTYGESSEVLAYYEVRMFDKNGDRIYLLNNEITVKSKLPEKYQTGYDIIINQEDDYGNLVEMNCWREGEYNCYKTTWLEKY